ncbi:MAG: DNA primase [Candidatus Liptonbacteria bacterium]
MTTPSTPSSGPIRSSPVEEIKQKLDIVEFLRGYLTVSAAGKNFKANCPFHKEKTPSFMISPERQSWHCFGCGIGGDVFSFVMRYENVEFGEALRILADKAGIELRRLNPAEYKYTGLLYELNQLAKEFFRKELENSAEAKKYLESRGLKQETINEFELGWAPNKPEALTFHLLNLNYRPEDMVQAGISFKTDRGAQIDRFRGRIMFPIHNHLGKVVGFTGRILPQLDNGQTGKYVNSPETAIFNKSKLLYGFWKSKEAIREAGEAFLVEGQMDFLMSYQTGVKNVFASSGTALSLDHLQTLKRMCEKIVVSFDTDSAGLAAGERAIELAEINDFQVKVLSLGKYKDPAEAAQNDPEFLKETVKNARPAPEFYFLRYELTGPVNMGDREVLQRIRGALQKLSHIASPVERSHWIKELSKRIGADEESLRQEMQALVGKQGQPAQSAQAASPETPAQSVEPITRWELLSQKLLSGMLAANNFELLSGSERCLAPGYEPVSKLLRQGIHRSEDSKLDSTLNLVVLRSEELTEKEISELKENLIREYAKERRKELTQSIRQAEAGGDEAAVKKWLEEVRELPTF